MEVICVNDNWKPKVMLDGAKPDGKLYPVKYEILKVDDSFLHPDFGLHYSFEKYNSEENINWFNALNFTDITILNDQIDAAASVEKQYAQRKHAI